MRRSILPLLFAVFLAFACAVEAGAGQIQGSGKAATEDRAVPGTTGVELNLPGDLTITLGDSETLTIDSEDNLLPYIVTRTAGGTLSIGAKPGTSLRPTRPMSFRLTLKSLDSLATNSSGNITAPAVAAGTFRIEINSSGWIHVDGLTADSLAATVNSSGDILIAGGRVASQNVTINSSGEYRAGDVRGTDADVRINSSGDATVWVSGRLSASLNSSGNVNYYGRPEVSQSTNSSGRVISLGDK